MSIIKKIIRIARYLLSLGIVFCFSTFTSCTKTTSSSIETKFILPSDSLIRYSGRFNTSDPSGYTFSYPGTSIEVRFVGTVCEFKLSALPGSPTQSYFYLIVDKKDPKKIAVGNETKVIKVPDLSSGEHQVTLYKLTEASVGKCIFSGVTISGTSLLPIPEAKRRMEFIGNSITCGYGNEGTSPVTPFSPETENNYLSYGAITARQLNAQYTAIAYSGRGMYRNYDGGTKETMSLIYDRILPDEESPKWDYQKAQRPDVVVINLGTNDCAIGIPDSTVFCNTYVNFLKRIRSRYPDAYIVCMEGPMTTNSFPAGTNTLTKITNYITACANILIKKGDKKVTTFFPAPQKEDELGCDYHPNVKKHQSMATELSTLIKNKLNW